MRLRFLLGLSAVILIAVGSVATALIVRDNEVDNFHEVQQDEAVRAARQAEAVARLSVAKLATAAAVFGAEEELSHREFETVSESLLGSGALTATAYAERVPHDRRAAYEASHGFPIRELGLLGRPRQADVRDVYFPVTYGLAEHAPSAALGYDLASDPDRSKRLAAARDHGRSTATPVMPLLIGGVGINVYRPVFRDGAPTETETERRAALVGVVAGAFRVGDLAAAAISTLPDEADVQIRAGSNVVAGPDVELADPARAEVDIADRTWVLVVRDPIRPGVSLPLLMAVFGLSLAALLGALVLIWSRNERMRELQREASQDPLTGLNNRRRFEEDLRREIARSRRDRTTGALLMLDLDNFKLVNDTQGHPAGDRVIERIANVLAGRVRETDVLARVGGDEFAIVLPNCGRGEAERVAESVATAIREQARGGDGPGVTASVGVAMFGPHGDADFDSVLGEADAAMYAVKDAGRDGVSVAG